MLVNKWNFKRHEYDQVVVPDDWNCCLYSTDMKRIVNCVGCGQKLEYGETYTSKQYHNAFGFGYAVCKDCYQNEWTLEAAACNG